MRRTLIAVLLAGADGYPAYGYGYPAAYGSPYGYGGYYRGYYGAYAYQPSKGHRVRRAVYRHR